MFFFAFRLTFLAAAVSPPSRDAGLGDDVEGRPAADPVDVREGDHHPLLHGEIDTGDASHLRSSSFPFFSLALALLVPRIGGADHPHHALAADDLALVADLLD